MGTQRPEEELERTAAEACVLARLAVRLAACVSVERVALAVREVSEELWSWDAFWIAVRQGGSGWFDALIRVDTVEGRRVDLPPMRAETSQFMIAGNLADGEPLLLNRAPGETGTGLARFGDLERLSASLMFAPLRFDGEILGVVSVQSYETGFFYERDRDLLMRIAEIAAPAVHRCRVERRSAALAGLGLTLSAATSACEAARVIVDVADSLLGWDACMLHLYSRLDDQVTPLIGMDVVDGQRLEVDRTDFSGGPPSPIVRRTLSQGAQLILRPADSPGDAAAAAAETDPVRLRTFGDRERRSASLMFVPVRGPLGSIGVFSIQSYSPNAYDQSDLDFLQALADHCSGALERVRAEEALRESETRFRLVAESLHDGLILTDLQNAIVYANRRMADLTGHPVRDMLGQRAYELLLPDSEWPPSSSQIRRRGSGGGGPGERYEVQLLRRDGSRFWAEIEASPMRNAAGDICGSLWAVSDITLRKQAAREEEVFSRLKVRLGGADTLEQLADAARIAADELWDWDAFFLSVRCDRTGGFQSVLAIDTIDGCRKRFARAGSNVSLLPPDHPILCAPYWLINREDGESDGSLGRFGDERRPSASLMFAAVRVRGEVVGVMSVQSYTPRRFGEEQAAVLLRMADTLGPAVSRCRAEQARRRIDRDRELFAELGRRLGAMTTPREAAVALLETADSMIGWDAAFCDAYLVSGGRFETLVAYDIVDGVRREVTGPYDGPGSLTTRILQEGGKLILRDPDQLAAIRPDGAYGDRARPSASLLYAVLRRGGASFGILSIQSYTCQAYTETDLERLQTLADFGSSAMHRLFAEEELRSSQERLRLLIEQIPAIVWSADSWLRLTLCTGSALKLVGLDAEALTGKPVVRAFGGGEDGAAVAAHRRALAGDSVQYEQELGGCFLSCYVHPLREPGGKIVGVTGMAHDVTDRRRAEEALAERARISEFAGAVGSTLASGSDPEGVLQQCAEHAVRCLGSDLAHVWMIEESATGPLLCGSAAREGRSLDFHPGVFSIQRIIRERCLVRVADPKPDCALCDPEWARRHGVRGMLGCPLLVGDKLIGVFVTLRRRAFTDGEAQVFASVADAMAQFVERKRAEKQLLHSACHDSLTGLPNRATLVECLEKALAQTRQQADYAFAILFLDLDRFKLVNDSLGHSAGDQLLIMAAARLVGCLRSGDMVARLGGDEFVVFLDGVTEVEEATAVARRILDSFRDPFRLGDQEAFSGVSIGIALSSEGYDRPEQILRDADTALYCAKAKGRRTWELFESSMHGKALDMLRMESDLRRAVERREFELHYQPIIELASGRITALEALLRWQHPVRGMVAPEEFIPLAEETGLIIPIGWWVLQEAVERLAQWRRLGVADSSLSISINVSPRQFRQPDLIERIQELLNRTGIEPHCLKLEITEGTLMENAETTTAMLLQLRALDIQLLVDDFGTGHSSLSYLHRFPIHALKVDRSFVRELGVTEEGLEIVRSIIRLAHGLGMEAIAEGVETVGQEAHLRGAECDFTQGFLFSRPIRADDVAELLRQGGAGQPNAQHN